MIVNTGVESNLVDYCGVVTSVQTIARGFFCTLVPMQGKADEIILTFKFKDVPKVDRRWIMVGRAFKLRVREETVNGEERCHYTGPPEFITDDVVNIALVNWAETRKRSMISGEHTKG